MASRREERFVRVLSAAAMPLLASTLLLTYSRAALALIPIGLIVYAVIGRPRRLIATLMATVVPVAIVLITSYSADEVSSARFGSAAGISQGHKLALLVVACSAVAALLRGLMTIEIDRRLEEWIPPVFEPRNIALTIAGACVALVLFALALGAPSWVGPIRPGTSSTTTPSATTKTRGDGSPRRAVTGASRSGKSRSTPSTRSRCTAPGPAPTSSPGPGTGPIASP